MATATSCCWTASCAQPGSGCYPTRTSLDLYGTRTLLMHGDLLCTDDRRYQAFRRVVRNRLVQRIALLLPLARRKALVGGARRMSTRETQAKSMNIMDVNQAAVVSALRISGVRAPDPWSHSPARSARAPGGWPPLRTLGALGLVPSRSIPAGQFRCLRVDRASFRLAWRSPPCPAVRCSIPRRSHRARTPRCCDQAAGVGSIGAAM